MRVPSSKRSAARPPIEDTVAAALHMGSNTYAFQLEAAAALVIKQLFAGAQPMTVLNLSQRETKPI